MNFIYTGFKYFNNTNYDNRKSHHHKDHAHYVIFLSYENKNLTLQH